MGGYNKFDKTSLVIRCKLLAAEEIHGVEETEPSQVLASDTRNNVFHGKLWSVCRTPSAVPRGSQGRGADWTDPRGLYLWSSIWWGSASLDQEGEGRTVSHRASGHAASVRPQRPLRVQGDAQGL